METNQGRVLAYQLAKELNPNDLGEVSGGGAMKWTHHQCIRPTGEMKSPDAELDVSIDW